MLVMMVWMRWSRSMMQAEMMPPLCAVVRSSPDLPCQVIIAFKTSIL